MSLTRQLTSAGVTVATDNPVAAGGSPDASPCGSPKRDRGICEMLCGEGPPDPQRQKHGPSDLGLQAEGEGVPPADAPGKASEDATAEPPAEQLAVPSPAQLATCAYVHTDNQEEADDVHAAAFYIMAMYARKIDGLVFTVGAQSKHPGSASVLVDELKMLCMKLWNRPMDELAADPQFPLWVVDLEGHTDGPSAATTLRDALPATCRVMHAVQAPMDSEWPADEVLPIIGYKDGDELCFQGDHVAEPNVFNYKQSSRVVREQLWERFAGEDNALFLKGGPQGTSAVRLTPEVVSLYENDLQWFDGLARSQRFLTNKSAGAAPGPSMSFARGLVLRDGQPGSNAGVVSKAVEVWASRLLPDRATDKDLLLALEKETECARKEGARYAVKNLQHHPVDGEGSEVFATMMEEMTAGRAIIAGIGKAKVAGAIGGALTMERVREAAGQVSAEWGQKGMPTSDGTEMAKDGYEQDAGKVREDCVEFIAQGLPPLSNILDKVPPVYDVTCALIASELLAPADDGAAVTMASIREKADAKYFVEHGAELLGKIADAARAKPKQGER